jgi:predicted chitinase/LysM repeat protein
MKGSAISAQASDSVGKRPSGRVSEARLSGYTIKSGDTLSAVAKAFNVPLLDLIKLNPQIPNPNRIYPGEVVRLPLPKEATNEQIAEPLRKSGSGMAGVGGLSPKTFLGMKGVNDMGCVRFDPLYVPKLPTDFPQGFQPVSAEQLRAIMPKVREDDLATLLIPLNRAMARFGINTKDRQAAFLGQIAVESGQFRYRYELASGEAYEGRAGLGNTQPGDGPRYKGRGLIQLTGRANYRRVGQALGLALENDPDLAALPENSANIAAYFFSSRGLNELADRGDVKEITRRVNGGDNGLEARTGFYETAKQVLV